MTEAATDMGRLVAELQKRDERIRALEADKRTLEVQIEIARNWRDANEKSIARAEAAEKERDEARAKNWEARLAEAERLREVHMLARITVEKRLAEAEARGDALYDKAQNAADRLAEAERLLNLWLEWFGSDEDGTGPASEGLWYGTKNFLSTAGGRDSGDGARKGAIGKSPAEGGSAAANPSGGEVASGPAYSEERDLATGRRLRTFRRRSAEPESRRGKVVAKTASGTHTFNKDGDCVEHRACGVRLWA